MPENVLAVGILYCESRCLGGLAFLVGICSVQEGIQDSLVVEVMDETEVMRV